MVKVLGTGLSLLVSLMVSTAIHAQQATEGMQTESQSALSVQLVLPERLVWPVTLETDGRFEPWQEALVSAEVGGQRIEEIFADVGTVVLKGDVLAQLSSETIQNTILQQQAAVRSAQAALEEATADAERARALRSNASGAMSQQQVTQYLAAEQKAEASYESAKAALESSRLDLERATIVAPDDGIISSRTGSLGAVVASGTELFRMIRQSRIEWQAEVPLRFLRDIEVGTKVALPTPSGSEVPGEVRLISPVSSLITGRSIVYVSLLPPEDAPTPKTGIMVTGKFVLGETEALTVPATATSMRDGFTYVFALEAGSNPPTVTRKRVETGRRQDERVEITSGLDGSEQIVKAGGAFLGEGSVVTIVEGGQ